MTDIYGPVWAEYYREELSSPRFRIGDTLEVKYMRGTKYKVTNTYFTRTHTGKYVLDSVELMLIDLNKPFHICKSEYFDQFITKREKLFRLWDVV